MSTIGGTRILYATQKQFKKAYADSMLPVVTRLQRLLLAAQDGKGTIPPAAETRLLVQAGDLVQRFFVGPDMRSAYDANNRALASFPELLNIAVAEMVYAQTESHSKFLRKRLPPDLIRWLETADIVREAVGRPFEPNPLAVYEPLHSWVDPRGYRLSDRIWQNSARVRQQLDAYLAEAIRTGTAARDIAAGVERFLLPTRAPLRTQRPYGQDASFDAMRLARTEIARAHASASYALARANPFVTGQDWALSARHPKVDICDKLATIGMNGQRLKEPYPMSGQVPLPVVDSHPQCLCSTMPYVGASREDVVQQLRARFRDEQKPPMMPVVPQRFSVSMLGSWAQSIIIKAVERITRGG